MPRTDILSKDPYNLEEFTKDAIEHVVGKWTVAQIKQRLTDLGTEHAKGLKAALIEQLVEELMKDEAGNVEIAMEDTVMEEKEEEKEEEKPKVAPAPEKSTKKSSSPPQKLSENDAAKIIQNAVKSKLLKSKKRKPSRSPSPKKRVKHNSDTLLITNFVRPLALSQVKSWMEEFGKVEWFWMDSIKTHCFVQFSKAQEAQACLEKVDGIKWPKERLDDGLLHAEMIDVEEAKRRVKEHETPKVKERVGTKDEKKEDKKDETKDDALSIVVDNTGKRSVGLTKEMVASPMVSSPHVPQPVELKVDPKYSLSESLPPLYYHVLTKEEVEEKKKNGWELRRDVKPVARK